MVCVSRGGENFLNIMSSVIAGGTVPATLCRPRDRDGRGGGHQRGPGRRRHRGLQVGPTGFNTGY